MSKLNGKGADSPDNIEVDSDAEIQDKLLYPVKSLRQAEKWDCGPTAVATAIRYQFGLRLTSNEIILLTAATPSGTDEYNFTHALDALGFKYKQSNYGTLNKCKKVLMDGQLPIVHLVMNDGGGHYVCLCGYDEENVWLADPALGKVVKYGISYFLGIWKVEEKESQTRWYMAITGYGGDKIDSLVSRYKKIQKKVQKARK